MNPLRAIAQYYATLSNMTVPPERFTEGHRSQLDVLPAIVYEGISETEDMTQLGTGLAELTVQCTVWGKTPAQARRIAEELRLAFRHPATTHTRLGNDPDWFYCKFCSVESIVNAVDWPRDGGADFACNSTVYLQFHYAAPAPATP